MTPSRSSRWRFWTGMLLLTVGGTAVGIACSTPSESMPIVPEEESAPVVVSIPVTTIHPRKGAMERTTTQPGTILAYESVQLFAKVPGFLKSQKVDIGDHVKRGQVLAVVDVPELEKQAQRDRAAVDQARAKILQMKARVTSAVADLDAAKAGVIQAEAAANSAAAWVRYRAIQHKRMKDLFATKSIEEKLVDEYKEHYEASVETQQAAVAAIATSKAKVAACAAKILQAEADVAAAQSEVQVAQAELEKVQVQVSFATITAPFDGVVAFRGMFPGDFVRAAGEGAHEPLLTVQRMDKMRVIVEIPDRDVPFADPGDPAAVEIDALPGEPLAAKISRIAHSEDPQTRLMRVEIDLPNPTGKICQGMYGRVTIVLEKSTNLLSMPSSCLVGRAEGGKGKVYVVRDGHAQLARVRLGADNGLRVIVLAGLKGEDQVIVQPGNALAEGTPVNPTLWDEAPPMTD